MIRPIHPITRAALWLLLALATPALAQTPFDRATATELRRIETDFEYGKYEAVLASSTARLEQGALSDAERLELNRLAALAAFNLGRTQEARAHFRSLLRQDPDHSLDPFRVPPPAIALFDSVRTELGAELVTIRERKASQEMARAEEAAARLRERSELEQLRAELTELNDRVKVRTVERHHILINFMPFGMGQFQQRRNGMGVGLAVSQGALAATSVVAYATRWSLRQRVTEPVSGRLGEDPFVRELWLLPNARRAEDELWAVVQFTSGIAFFAAWALGTVDALLHHRDIESIEPVPPDALSPGVSLHVVPVGDGASVGLSLRF